MRNINRTFVLFGLLAVLFGLPAVLSGCGGGDGGGSTGSGGGTAAATIGGGGGNPTTTGSLSVNFTLKATDVEANVTHFRFTFSNGATIVSGPTTVPKAASVTLTNLPAGTLTMFLEYLVGGTVSHTMTSSVTITAGGTTTVSNPNVTPVTPPDTTPPAAPTGVAVVDPATDGDLNVSWVNPVDADFASARVYRSTAAGTLGTLVNTTAGTTFADSGLTNGTQVFYTVRSVDTTGNESTNTAQTSGTPSTSPPVPTFDLANPITSAANTGGGQPALGSLLVPRGNQVLVLDGTSLNPSTAITDGEFTNLRAVTKDGTVLFAADSDAQILRKDGASAASVLVDLSINGDIPRGLQVFGGKLWALISADGVNYSVRGYNMSTGAQEASFSVANGVTAFGILASGHVVIGAGTTLYMYTTVGGDPEYQRNLGNTILGVAELDGTYFCVGLGGTSILVFHKGDSTLATRATYNISDVVHMVATLAGSLYVIRDNNDDCQRYARTN